MGLPHGLPLPAPRRTFQSLQIERCQTRMPTASRRTSSGASWHAVHRSPVPLLMHEQDLIYDWNEMTPDFDWASARVQLNDETLRDGLQCPSVTDPDIADKRALLHLIAELGIASADIVLPGAGARACRDTLALAREIAETRLPLEANCAARTIRSDVEPIAAIAQETGMPLEAATFIGSSPIRQYAEDWTLDRMLRSTEEAVTFCVREGLSVMFVTEDTTRAAPDTLRAPHLSGGHGGTCHAHRRACAGSVCENGDHRAER